MGTKLWKVGHFNPLPRKEGDHRSQRVPCPVGDFNPLPRKEGDLNLFWMPDDTLISIHSLVKRETISRCNASYCSGISIHSLVKRETLKNPSRLLISQSISIHSLVKRETAAINMVFPDFLDFNPLPRKEGDSKFR